MESTKKYLLDHVDKDIYKLTEQEKKEYGIRKLPTSLLDAIESLESDTDFLNPAFANDFIEMYCQIKRMNIQQLPQYLRQENSICMGMFRLTHVLS